MFEFQPNRMQILKFRAEIESNSTFKKVFTTDITEDWWEDVKSKDHAVLFIHGQTGTLKSSSGQEVAMILQEDFKPDQISFSSDELLRRFRTSKPGETYIRDESPDLFGIGSVRIASHVNMLAEALRQRGNSLIFIAPTQNKLIEPAHYNLKTVAPLTVDGKYVRLAVQEPDTQRYLGAIMLEIHYDNPVWIEYQKAKKAFLERVPLGEFRELDINEMAKEALGKIDLEKDKTGKERLLRIREIFPNITTREVSDVCIRVNQMIREGET